VWLKASAASVEEPLLGELKLLEQSGVVACFVLAGDGGFRWANGLCREWLTGSPTGTLEGRKLEQWLRRAEDREAVSGAARAGELRDVRFELERGSRGVMSARGELIAAGGAACLVGIFRDAGEGEDRLKAGMERSARLEALGSLTSGVAHDFNNLLTILVGNLALVAEELRDDPKKFARLKAARDAAKRGGELIRQLLSFARQEPVESDLIDPAKIIGRIAPLIQRALGSRVKLELGLDEQMEPVNGNSAQLESVIVNLAINARDAIESSGTVRIAVRSSQLDASVAEARGLSQGKHVCIEVADDGAGIPESLAGKVFDPFFTTKRERGGTGLGLSMVRSYAEQFGGPPELLSSPGQGTTIRLWFPCKSGNVEDSAAMTMPMAMLPTGEELVFVLAADRSLRSMLDQLLSMLGYRVNTLADLGAATRAFREGRPDLLISDGFEVRLLLEAQARTAPPKTRVLMLKAAGAVVDSADRHVLQKPFALPDLATAVRRALDAE
jgi:hypothetical protein